MTSPGSTDFDLPERLARDTMSRILGASRSAQLYSQVMDEIGRSGLQDVEDLMRFARALTARGGFEGSVGALLSVQATMRGARG